MATLAVDRACRSIWNGTRWIPGNLNSIVCDTGKNRPLDEDELDFLERVRSQQRAKEHLEREQDSVELDAFQLVSE